MAIGRQVLTGMASVPVPASHDFVELAADESPAEHPMANTGLYGGDIALLNYLLQDLRVITRQGEVGSTELTKYRDINWDVHGLKRRTVICDRSVRIHNGCLPGGPIGSGTVIIQSTKYWDYDCAPAWTAKRHLPGGAVEVLDSPSEPES